MNSLIIKARLKLLLISVFIFIFIFATTKIFRANILYQLILFLCFFIYYLLTNRERLITFLNFTKFLFIVIILLHGVFFLYKFLSMGSEFAISFYKKRGESIFIRIFIIPNIFAFVNILISKISFIDIILLSGNNKKSKIVYILMISGIEVMERLKIYYEYHPLNMTNRGFQKILHYLAVPLTLFFGIYRGFEHKYKTLLEREKILEEKI